MTILAEAAGLQRIGRVMSVVGAPMLLGPMLAPVLGGLILQSLSRRWIFYVNVPTGVLAPVLARRLLPRSEPQRGERLDAVGLALLSPGLAAIVFDHPEADRPDRRRPGRARGVGGDDGRDNRADRLTGHTPFTLTSGILFVRLIGMGFAMMPAMTAAYSTISRAAVPRTTTALNVLQRVGWSIGTALLAVVLEDQLKSSVPHAVGVSRGAVRPISAGRQGQDRGPAGARLREHLLVRGGARGAGDHRGDRAGGQGARAGGGRGAGAAGGVGSPRRYTAPPAHSP
jgi:MFS family permease